MGGCGTLQSMHRAFSSPNVELSNNVFHGIVRLYIRVRSFSCAKDIIQHYKINAKQSKGKALRKEIMRSHEQETVRQD